MGPPPAMSLSSLGLSDAAIHAFAAALQGVLTEEVGAELPSPYPAAPTWKVAALSLLHLRFVCGVTRDGDLPPIWEAVARGRRRMEGLATLNQALMRGLPFCLQVFNERAHFCAPPPLLAFVKNVIPLKPSLDTFCTEGGSCPS